MGATGKKNLLIFGVEKANKMIYALKCKHNNIYRSFRCESLNGEAIKR